MRDVAKGNAGGRLVPALNTGRDVTSGCRHAQPVRRNLESGIEHFNALRFWEAHEAWEEIWLEADEDAEFFQGLIQLAAAYHHVRRGTFPGAVRLFEAAARRLQSFPEGFHGVDRRAALEASERHRILAAEKAGISDDEYPKLALIEN